MFERRGLLGDGRLVIGLIWETKRLQRSRTTVYQFEPDTLPE